MDRLSTLAFSTLLWGIALAMKFTAWRHPAFRERLKEQNLVAQIRVKQLPIGATTSSKTERSRRAAASTKIPTS